MGGGTERGAAGQVEALHHRGHNGTVSLPASPWSSCFPVVRAEHADPRGLGGRQEDGEGAEREGGLAPSQGRGPHGKRDECPSSQQPVPVITVITQTRIQRSRIEKAFNRK